MLLPSDWTTRVERAQTSELATIIGELAQAQATVWARLHRPVISAPAESPASSSTRMVGIDEAAQLLGMSTSWLYRNAARIPGATKPNGHNWRFSTQGIEKHLRARQPKAAGR